MAWRRSRATSTTSRETSSDGDDADGDADDADDADALDVEVEVAREGCGRDRWRRTRGDAWGGTCLVVIGRWGRVIHSKRGVRNDDLMTGRLDDDAHTQKTVGRTRCCVGIFKYASSRRERRGMTA
jgi:hypothetical protein